MLTPFEKSLSLENLHHFLCSIFVYNSFSGVLLCIHLGRNTYYELYCMGLYLVHYKIMRFRADMYMAHTVALQLMIDLILIV